MQYCTQFKINCVGVKFSDISRMNLVLGKNRTRTQLIQVKDQNFINDKAVMKDSADTYELRAIEQRTEEGHGNLMESLYELRRKRSIQKRYVLVSWQTKRTQRIIQRRSVDKNRE